MSNAISKLFKIGKKALGSGEPSCAAVVLAVSKPAALSVAQRLGAMGNAALANPAANAAAKGLVLTEGASDAQAW